MIPETLTTLPHVPPASTAVVAEAIEPTPPLVLSLPKASPPMSSSMSSSLKTSRLVSGDETGGFATLPEDNIVDLDVLGSDRASSVLEEGAAEETVSVNDTLKVIFVGMAKDGKKTMNKRMIDGRD